MARLGDCFCVIRNGASIKQMDDSGGLPITRIETISNREVDRSKLGYAGIKDAQKYQDYLLQDCDILMSHINSTKHLGKVAIYRKKEQIIHGMNLLMLRANQSVICPQYAFYYFDSDDFKRQILRITKNSVNQASFTVTALKELKIPLPPLDEQRKIAAVLDKISDLTAKRRRQLDKLDELVKSRFVEMFGDSETNTHNLPVLPWCDVFKTTTGKLDSNAMVDGGQYPFFTCAKEVFAIDDYAFDCEALLLAGNNAAGVYDVKHYSGKFNAYQRTYVLRLNNDKWSYPLFQRQLEYKLQYLQKQSRGTNTRYLTLGILNQLHFLIPSVEDQHCYDVFIDCTDKIVSKVNSSIAMLETLKKSLMQEYFSMR